MTLRKTLGLLTVSFIFLSGCTTTHTEAEIVNTKPPLLLEVPQHPSIGEYDFSVVTDKNTEDKFLELTKKGRKPVYFCLTPSEYEILSKDVVKHENYIAELLLIIEKYKLYYESE